MKSAKVAAKVNKVLYQETKEHVSVLKIQVLFDRGVLESRQIELKPHTLLKCGFTIGSKKKKIRVIPVFFRTFNMLYVGIATAASFCSSNLVARPETNQNQIPWLVYTNLANQADSVSDCDSSR